MSLTQIARNCSRFTAAAVALQRAAITTAQPQMRMLHKIAAPALFNGLQQVSSISD